MRMRRLFFLISVLSSSCRTTTDVLSTYSALRLSSNSDTTASLEV